MMRYFKDTAGQVHGYDEAIEFFTPLIAKAIAARWLELTGSWPLPETQEQAQTRLSATLTSAINDGAQQWGYDDIVCAISYAGNSNAQYAAESTALNQWRDQVWAWAIPELAKVTPGQSAGQFLANMPAAPQRPKV